MTLYGYARVSVREPEDKNLDLQVERLVRAGCSLGNIRAEEASGARNDRRGLLELLDLVVEGDTLVVKVQTARSFTGAGSCASAANGWTSLLYRLFHLLLKRFHVVPPRRAKLKLRLQMREHFATDFCNPAEIGYRRQ